MDDSDASPISESEVLEGSVASAVASGSAAPEFIRLPEYETTAADEPDGYWQRRGKCSARRRIRTTTWKRNTITDGRALVRFFDPQVIFQVQTKLHIHRSWRIPAKISIDEPMEQTQVTELSITSWNPDTPNHGTLERFLTYFDADIIIFQGTRLRMRTIPRDGKAKDDTITPVRSEWCSRGYKIFSWGWSNGEFSNHACGLLFAIREATVGAGQIVQRYDPPRSMAGRYGGIRVKNWQAHGDLTILAGYAPQESGPSQHKEHFWDQVTKTMAKHPRRTSIIFGGDFNGDPLPDDAAIGWQHLCENLSHGQWSAHRRDLQSSAALESVDLGCEIGAIEPPCWEGNTWRGYTGEQSRPDHILLSVDLASPPVTVDSLSPQET